MRYLPAHIFPFLPQPAKHQTSLIYASSHFSLIFQQESTTNRLPTVEVSLSYNHFFWMMRILLTLTGLLVLNAVSGCSGIFYFPQKTHVQTPERSGLDYEDVFLESADNVTIHGWWLKARAPVRGTVYFLHGNAENISTHFQNVAWLPEHGYQVFLIDYRGFGKSQGKARLPGALQDVGTGFQFVLDRNTEPGKPIYLLGQSVGASMAIYFAANDPRAKQNLSAVISDAAFTRYVAVPHILERDSRLRPCRLHRGNFTCAPAADSQQGRSDHSLRFRPGTAAGGIVSNNLFHHRRAPYSHV
jgi:hypothetical protein